MFNRRGNFIGGPNPDDEERFCVCNVCCQMFDMDSEGDGESEICLECIEKDQEVEKEEYNSDVKLERRSK